MVRGTGALSQYHTGRYLVLGAQLLLGTKAALLRVQLLLGT